MFSPSGMRYRCSHQSRITIDNYVIIPKLIRQTDRRSINEDEDFLKHSCCYFPPFSIIYKEVFGEHRCPYFIVLHRFVRQTFCQILRPEPRRIAIGQRVAVKQKGVGLGPPTNCGPWLPHSLNPALLKLDVYAIYYTFKYTVRRSKIL